MGDEEWQAGEPVPVQERPAYETDPWFYRIVVATLGLAVVGSVAGIVLLSWLSQSGQVPDALVAIGSGAIGALAGVFTVK